MTEVNIPEMMAAGAHFGHQTKRWNPKMRQYIYGARSGVHILDLQKTKSLAAKAFEFVEGAVASGKSILFVATKKQARELVKEQAERAKQHYVNDRWMGGTLTNFKTIKHSIDKLIDLERRRKENDFKGYSKRELLEVDRTIMKLEASLGGIKGLTTYPDVVFVVDPKHEYIAVHEANKLGIPVVAITDSNCDPEPIDYVVPANDDAIASIVYFVQKMADACLAGLEKRDQFVRLDDSHEAKHHAKHAPKRKRVVTGEEEDHRKDKKKTAYVSRAAKSEFEGDAAEGFSAKVGEVKEGDVEVVDAQPKTAAVG